MEGLVEKVKKILEQFIQEELGNRLSQFAWIAFSNMVLNEIRNYKTKEKEKSEVRKEK